MRLLFVIDSFTSGGAQRQMVNLALGLVARGHAPECFVYQPPDELSGPLRSGGVPIHRHLKPWRYSPRTLFALRKQLARGGYDLVLSYLPVPNLYSILARKLMRGKPALVISERSSADPLKQTRRHLLIEQAYRWSDHLVVNSHHLREYYQARYPWLRGHVTTVYNGLDVNLFHPLERQLPDEPLRLIGVGRVAQFKNWLCLIDALAMLRDEHCITATVTLAGRLTNLNPGEASYLDEMRSTIARHKLDGQWEFVGERPDMVELLNQHHALVHPSWLEGFPNVVCEALACGLPVIVSDTLDHPRVVQHGQTGYLFDHRDPRSLAAAIKQFHDLDAAARGVMRTAARAYAEAHFSLDRLVDDYERLFQSVIAGH